MTDTDLNVLSFKSLMGPLLLYFEKKKKNKKAAYWMLGYKKETDSQRCGMA